VSLYETDDCVHANHVDDSTHGLSAEMKKFIEEKFCEGITKPNALLKLIVTKKMKERAKLKLVSFLIKLHEKQFGPAGISVPELCAWCAARTHIPADEDEVFVLKYVIHAESRNVDEQELKIVMSTRRLLAISR